MITNIVKLKFVIVLCFCVKKCNEMLVALEFPSNLLDNLTCCLYSTMCLNWQVLWTFCVGDFVNLGLV